MVGQPLDGLAKQVIGSRENYRFVFIFLLLLIILPFDSLTELRPLKKENFFDRTRLLGEVLSFNS